MTSTAQILWFIFGASGLAVVYGAGLAVWVLRRPAANEQRLRIAAAIQEGSRAYLNRQYRAVAVVAVLGAAMLWYVLGATAAAGFLIGGAASAVAGYVGMMVAVRANVRTTDAAEAGLAPAFLVAFRGGSVTGMLVVGLGLLVVAGFYGLTRDVGALIALGFGGSLISVFARLGGGIYTKAADVGADLVGKVEAGIPEDDPRNPAVIADNVGDNVGDCAGMAADLFETYAVTMIAAMLLAGFVAGGEAKIVLYPLALGATAILTSIAGTLVVRLGKSGAIMPALYRGLAASAGLAAVFFWPVTARFFSAASAPGIYLSSLVGLAVTALLMLVTDYYTSRRFRPVRAIAQASEAGHGPNIITGLAVSMESVVLPVIIIGAGVIAAFSFAGIYGVAIASVGMLSLAGVIVAIDSFGPITDNASGIAEMSGASKRVRDEVLDPLDAVGNTTKAVTKGYAIGSAGLAALVLFAAYTEELGKLGSQLTFSLSEPLVLVGLFVGGAVPYLFGSLAMRAVGKTASSVVAEVRRQFRDIPGIMAGTTRPEYGRAVDIVTKAALREMLWPALLPVAVPIAIGLTLGPTALGGVLVGALVTGLLVAVSMTSGGAAWDNAKKFIEAGNHGGKRSPAHQAAVTGDTVGDPYKDTAGPAMNPMIKIINIVALLITAWLIR
ncbi:sodium-translocating pyrophosphatase [Candidatus Parcubacteria bacterium]|nr:sodium-translocating pyrophosphatase [Candidatus Parcubacteria bacterium]